MTKFIAAIYLLAMTTMFTGLSIREYNRDQTPINLTVAFMTLAMILATIIIY